MKLTIENPSSGTTINIEVEDNDLDIEGMFEELIEPMLLAMGYHQKTISRFLGDDD